MRKVLFFVIYIIILGFCSCSSNIDSSSLTKIDKKYIVKESVQPIQEKLNAVNTQKDDNPKVNYDEMRAVWMSYIDLSPMLTGKTEIEFKNNFDNACKNIKDLNCNTIFVHVRPFGDALYKSELYPCSKYITGAYIEKLPFDPLEIMVDTAHNYGLSIHAWINPFRLENEDAFKKYKDSYLIKQWYKNKNGYVCKVENDNHLWLNPGFSDVRKLIADGVEEIAQNYNVDGIHFDDYFYPTTDESFDKQCYVSVGGDKSLSLWRLENVSNVVQMIYNSVKSVNKNIVVGVSPQGNIENNYSYMYADVKKWGSTQGYVDYICPQIYFGYNNPVKPFLETLKEWKETVTCKDVKLYIGLAVYKVLEGDEEFAENTGIISRQIEDVFLSPGCKGFALYNYINVFSDKKRAVEELSSIRNVLSEK